MSWSQLSQVLQVFASAGLCILLVIFLAATNHIIDKGSQNGLTHCCVTADVWTGGGMDRLQTYLLKSVLTNAPCDCYQ